MQQSFDAMTTALRVLKAINERRDPDPSDVRELKRLAPFDERLSIDELACRVIENALRHRAEVRPSSD
jgi:hypothetical protein